MRKEIDKLMREYRSGGLSRRELAAGLAAAAAAVAVPAVAKEAGGEGIFSVVPPSPAAVFEPPAAGGGADDFQAIQDTIDAAAAAGGGQVSITEPLSVGSTLTLRSGVELVGAGRVGSSIAALSSIAGSSLVAVEPDAVHAGFYGLTLDGAGNCPDAVIELGAGCKRIRVSGVRLTGWSPGTSEVAGVSIDAPPDPSGSGTPIHDVVIEGCDLEELGNGVTISGGAEHVAVLNCRFRGMHRRGIWLSGSAQLSSRYVEVTGNVMLDFPLEPGLGRPITMGQGGDKRHKQIHVNRNVIIGNGGYHGPGGLGTHDQIFLRNVVGGQVACNASIDGGEAGFVVAECSDVVLLGNASVASDTAGFLIEGRSSRSLRIQLLANYAQNNGQNREGASLADWALSGFLLRDRGSGVVDTNLAGNYSWDDQGASKTQNYALAVAHDTVHVTLLSGNFWRPALHAIADVYNRGRGTQQAAYSNVPRIP